MENKYILALDQGTSSSRAILFNHQAQIIGVSQKETRQYYPAPGMVEQDAEDIFNGQYTAALEVMMQCNVKAAEIAGIAITNQRETSIVWNRKTGCPVYHAIIWQDNRTASLCNKLKEEGWEDYIRKNTGLVIDSYFSATKLNWILHNVADAKTMAENGDLLFGTVDTFLLWKLSGGKVHATDYSNASRTMLFNINTLQWDESLLKLFEIPRSMLPEVCDSSHIYTYTSKIFFDGIEIPVAGIAGDQQAALFGQACFHEGMAKNTYGTGCFMLKNIGKKPVISANGLITTIAWGLNHEITYALEGSVFIAGAVVKWLRDELKILSSAVESEQKAVEAGSNLGVYFVPAFSGMGAPYWNMDVRAVISGLTLGAKDIHIVRAALESMAYQTMDVIRAMELDSGRKLKSLNVDGGAVVNDFLMQFQADILNCKVTRPEIIETTALGAAFFAGLAIGFWGINELESLRKSERIFIPAIDENQRKHLCSGWEMAVRQAQYKGFC